MADTAITVTPLNKDVSYRQAQMPVSVYGTYAGDDADYHTLTLDAKGKGHLVYGVDNKTDKTVTVTLYGAHSATGVVGGDGVFAIDSTGFTVAASSTGYSTNADSFPYIIVRLKFADVPDGSDVVVYADYTAF